MFYVVFGGNFTQHQFSYLGKQPKRMDPTLPSAIIHFDSGPKIGKKASGPFAIEIMTRKVISCSPLTKIEKILSKFGKMNFHHLPVISKGKLVGLVSDRDLLSLKKSGAFHFLTAKDVMSNVVVCCDEDTLIADIAKVMIKENVSALPVIDSDHLISGIITKTNLLKFMAG